MTDAAGGTLVGRQLGVYRIEALIGEGGMGQVYRARDTRLGREVAIKVLPGGLAESPDRLQRFQREARVLASLNDPHVGAIYGLEESDGVFALILELVPGDTLAARLARGPIPHEEALRLARQMAAALDEAHERGIVHRDLKPANIKITPDGVVKVLDFGLAKALAGASPGSEVDASLTISTAGTEGGVILGTASYMSPEQARGQAVDKRTDIWAFGCVLFEMLTGRLAFPGRTLSDSIASTLTRDPDWTALPSRTPPVVQRLLARCLEKDLRRRMRDMGDVCIDLDEALAGPSVTGSDGRRRMRDPVGWIVAGTLLVALVATAGLEWRGRTRPPTIAAPGLSRPVRLTSGTERAFGAAVSPDGKWVAYYSNQRGPTDLWVSFLDTGARLNLTEKLNLDLPVRAGIGGLSISPDGTQIAFLSRADPAAVQYRRVGHSSAHRRHAAEVHPGGAGHAVVSRRTPALLHHSRIELGRRARHCRRRWHGRQRAGEA